MIFLLRKTCRKRIKASDIPKKRGQTKLKAMGCPKINLQIRNDNIGAVKFYEKIGYKIDEVQSMGKRLVED